MPFPFSAQGTIVLESHAGIDLAQIISAVEAAIQDAKPTSMVRHEETLTFRAGLFRLVSNWNQLVAITSGELRFSQDSHKVNILYNISFIQLLVATTVLVTVIFGVLPGVFENGPNVPLGFVLLAWLWLFGGNYFLTLFRFPRFVRAAAERSQKVME